MMSKKQLADHVETELLSHIVEQLYKVLHDGEKAKPSSKRPLSETKEMFRNAVRKSTRSKFRNTLAEVVGPAPAESSVWKEQASWQELVTEGDGLVGVKRTFEQTVEHLPQLASADAFHALQVKKGNHKLKLDLGYTQEEAECLGLLMNNSGRLRAALARGVEERSGRYAAATHCMYTAIATKAANGTVAPKCYRHLSGRGSLSSTDPRWLNILTPDAHGWRGFTSYGPLLINKAEKKRYAAEGIKYKNSTGEKVSRRDRVQRLAPLYTLTAACPSLHLFTPPQGADVEGDGYANGLLRILPCRERG
jgi:hypothetical protein